MPSWPPDVILAAHHDTIRRTVREMVRNSGVKDLAICGSCREVHSALGRDIGQSRYLILDGALPDALESVKEFAAGFGARLKVILIFSGPTQKDIQAAIEAGVSEIVTYPFSQATVEKKLKKLAGFSDGPRNQTQEREFPRRDVPAMLVVPALSDSPIVPENISGGGFMVVAQKKLALGTVIPCALQINGEGFPDLRARVARVEEQATPPLTWIIGLALQIARSQQEALASFIEKTRKRKAQRVPQADPLEELMIG